jgi:DNA polymerase III psi subunit
MTPRPGTPTILGAGTPNGVISMLQKQVRAAEYRRLSVQAAALAESSALEHVREKHETAAARWADLAALDEES